MIWIPQQPTRRTFLKGLGFLSVAALTGPLAGCLPKGLSQDLTIAMGGANNEEVFIKDRLRIKQGDTITWILQSSGHTATAYHPDNHSAYPSRIPEGAEPFDSPLLFTKGDTYEWTFETEGVYNYFCRPHEGSGMVGIIVVGNPVDGPGLATPEEDLPRAARLKLSELIAWAKNLPAR